MRRDQLRQWIWPFPPRAHVVVIERLDDADFSQKLFPILHPRMR
jgi:hypothetical protein